MGKIFQKKSEKNPEKFSKKKFFFCFFFGQNPEMEGITNFEITKCGDPLYLKMYVCMYNRMRKYNRQLKVFLRNIISLCTHSRSHERFKNLYNLGKSTTFINTLLTWNLIQEILSKIPYMPQPLAEPLLKFGYNSKVNATSPVI